ncbi:MAG: DUF4430 domain-containing protein [Bacteroidota bacterium]
MKKSKQFLFPSLFCFFLLTQAVSAQTSCKDCLATPCSTVSVAYTYNGSTYSYPNIPWVEGMNVTVAMLSAQETESLPFTTKAYCPFGNYMVSINGIYTGSQSYWQLQVNGAPAAVGMDFQQLNANDSVNWVLTSYQSRPEVSLSHQQLMTSMHVKHVLDK